MNSFPALVRDEEAGVRRRAVTVLPFPFIGSDNLAIAQLVAEHLLERGFRHFAFSNASNRLGITARCCKTLNVSGRVVGSNSRHGLRVGLWNCLNRLASWQRMTIAVYNCWMRAVGIRSLYPTKWRCWVSTMTSAYVIYRYRHCRGSTSIAKRRDIRPQRCWIDRCTRRFAKYRSTRPEHTWDNATKMG